jgi:hypothetical protein
MTLFCGVDVGASATKLVLVDGAGECRARVAKPSGVDYAATCRAALSDALAEAGARPEDVARTVATGYGRTNVGFATLTRIVGQFAQYYGLTTHCVEVGPRDQRGVDGHYWVSKGAILYAAEHREDMFNDQIEIFKRGTNFGGPEGNEFPYAYIIPMDENQKDAVEAAKTVELLVDADIDVMVATKEFEYNDNTYGKGTYVVPMNQALAGLANTLLWESEDLTVTPGLPMYDIAASSLPELCST